MLLFVLIVTLFSLIDNVLQVDKSVKLTDLVIPERVLVSFFDVVDFPDFPAVLPVHIAHPVVVLPPTPFFDLTFPIPTSIFPSASPFFRHSEYIPLFQIQPPLP
jgi:hypothetical protein